MRQKQVEFSPPKGFTVPEGVNPGDEFDLVCTLRMKDGGTICLTKLGDVPMPGYDHDESMKKPGNYGEYAEGMMASKQGYPDES